MNSLIPFFFRKRKIIGIDIGSACAKAVVLEARPNSTTIMVREFAILPIEDPAQPLSTTLKLLLRKLRTNCRVCALAAWPNGARLRFIDHSVKPEEGKFVPKTQEAFRNSSGSKIGEYVLDCDELAADPGTNQPILLECGIPRPEMYALRATFHSLGYQLSLLQLSPVAIFNAFSTSQADVVANRAYMVLDIGKSHTSMAIGGHKIAVKVRDANTLPVADGAEGAAPDISENYGFGNEDDEDNAPKVMGPLRLVRTLPTGWGDVEDTLALEFGVERHGDLETMPSDDEVMHEAVRDSMRRLISSIEQTLNYVHNEYGVRLPRKIFLSGPLGPQTLPIQVLAEELKVQVAQWNPLRQAVAATKVIEDFRLLNDLSRLTAASGAAFQYLL